MREKLIALAKKHGATGLQVVYHNGQYLYFSGVEYYEPNEESIQKYLRLKTPPVKTPAAVAH